MQKGFVDTYRIHGQDRRAMLEDNDCTVVSLAHVMRWPYREAHSLAALKGREQGRPTYMEPIAMALDAMTPVSLPHDEYPTLAEFCRVHPVGRFWINANAHALAVVNGKVCDHSPCRRRRVYRAWAVKL